MKRPKGVAAIVIYYFGSAAVAVGLVGGIASKAFYGFMYPFGIWSIAQDLMILALNITIVVYLLSSAVRRAFLSAPGDM